MGEIQGVDFAAPCRDAPALKAAGKHFAGRYLSTPGNPKNVTAPEAKALRKAGLAIVLVFEIEADRALGGYQRGRADAKSARAQADAVGASKAVPIFFAVDFDAQESQLPRVVSYIKGAASVLTPAKTGVYGGRRAVQACLDAKACKYAWQTAAWSGGEWDPRAHLCQYENGVTVAGLSVDLNRAVKADYGQWKAVAAPKPKPHGGGGVKNAPVGPPFAPGSHGGPETAIRGPHGGLIARRPLEDVRRALGGLLKRFGTVTVSRKG